MGATGRASGNGFYARDGAQRLAVDLETLEYRPAAKPRLDAVAAARKGGLPALVATTDRYGDYAKTVLTKVLDYASAMVPEVTDQPALIDLAMERGFNWKLGPFGMIEQLGGPPAPAAVRRAGVVMLSDLGPSGARIKPLGDALGRRRRRRLPRVSHQGQRHRRRRAGADRADSRRRRRALPGAGDLQRGRLLLDRRQPRPSADAGKRGRLGSGAPLWRAWPTRLRRPQVRTGAGDRSAHRTRARRRLRGALALRRGAGPHRDIHGPGRAGRGTAAGLGRLPRASDPRHRDLAGRADATGRQGV